MTRSSDHGLIPPEALRRAQGFLHEELRRDGGASAPCAMILIAAHNLMERCGPGPVIDYLQALADATLDEAPVPQGVRIENLPRPASAQRVRAAPDTAPDTAPVVVLSDDPDTDDPQTDKRAAGGWKVRGPEKKEWVGAVVLALAAVGAGTLLRNFLEVIG